MILKLDGICVFETYDLRFSYRFFPFFKQACGCRAVVRPKEFQYLLEEMSAPWKVTTTLTRLLVQFLNMEETLKTICSEVFNWE